MIAPDRLRALQIATRAVVAAMIDVLARCPETALVRCTAVGSLIATPGRPARASSTYGDTGSPRGTFALTGAPSAAVRAA